MRLDIFFFTIIVWFLSSFGIEARNHPEALPSTRKDLADFASLWKKLEKKPEDIHLQEEVVTTLGHAAFRVFYYDEMDMPKAEKMMVYYTYSKLLDKLRPRHYDVRQYSNFIFDGNDLETYDMKLIRAEAQLMHSRYENEAPYTIHRLRIIRDMLKDMENQPISLASGVDQYKKWTALEVSDSRRCQLLEEVEDIINSFSVDVYHETANTMLNWWLWRHDIKIDVQTAKKYLDTYYFAKEKAEVLGDHDAASIHARYNEYDGDKGMASFIYNIAAEKGGIDGILNVARLIIEDSCSTQKDYTKALGLLQSIEHHVLFANKGGESLLGRMYERGMGVAPSDSIALHHYSAAYQAMRLQKGYTGAHHNYETKMIRENSKKKEALNDDINRLSTRIQLNQLIQHVKSIDSKKMSSDGWFMLACRFYLLNDAINGKYYMELAAKDGSKNAKSILDWQMRSPKYPVREMIHSKLK